MKKILIVSATNNSNFTLSKKLEKISSKLGADVKTISLESFSLPLYVNDMEIDVKKQHIFRYAWFIKLCKISP